MLNTVKQTAPDVYIVPDPFRCTSVDPEAAAQARTFYYKVVRNTKSCTKKDRRTCLISIIKYESH